MDQSEPDRLNWTNMDLKFRMDQIRLNYLNWTEKDQTNWIGRYGLKWTVCTEIEIQWTTEVDQNLNALDYY